MNHITAIEETHLFKEIHEQPEVIQQLISQKSDHIQDLADEIHAWGIKHIFIAARGTSDNAGRYANYLLGAHNQLVVSLATPSLFTVYGQPPNLSNTLVLGISQSGKSPDIVSVIQEGKRQGALTAAITNVSGSDLAKAADITLDLNAGDELSLAATKTYTAQLTTLALLSHALNPNAQFEQELIALPTQIKAVFSQEDTVKKIAERYTFMEHNVVIGRGFNYATAFEFSLKLKELTYTITEPYSSADFLHGPVAVVEHGFPVFVIAPDGQMVPELKSLVERVKARDAEIFMISNQPDLIQMADHVLALPTAIPEWLSPIPAIIPGQLFAMYLAKSRRIDVDNPRGLKKVTETW